MSEKTLNNAYPVHELILKRWSPQVFSDQPIERDKILSLLEAARWASSCFNEQPWSFIIATKDTTEEHQQLLSCLAEGNKIWAQNAPLLMISIAKLNFDRNGKPNRHAFHDVGMAVGNLIMQASAMDLYVHQMGGFSVKKAKALYQIPEDQEPVAAIAVGYLGEDQMTPRSRKPLSDFVYSGQWNRNPLILNE